MEYSQEEKIKIQIENNNCIISTLKSNKTNSNISTNKNTKASSLKKVSKNLSNNLDNELSLSISKSSDDDLPNNNKDISMLEITDKSIFFSDMNMNNGSLLKKTPEAKVKSGREKKIKKLKEAVARKLNFDLSKNNNMRVKNENKYPLLNKIILDYQQLYKPKEKIKCNFIRKRITKKIKMNLNFKEITLHKISSFKGNNNQSTKEEEKCITISNSNFSNNYFQKKNISYNNIFDYSKPVTSNIRSSFKLSKENNETKAKDNKQKLKKNSKFRKQLSSSMNNREQKFIQKYKDKYRKEMLNRINTLYNNRNSCFNYNNCMTNLKSVNNSFILKTNYNNENDDISKNSNIDNIKLSFIKNKPKKKLIKTSNNSVSNVLNKNISSDNKPKMPNKKYNYNYNYRKPTQSSTYRRSLNTQNNKKTVLKNLVKIFGKELYNPIKSKNGDNIIKNHNNIINKFNLFNIIVNNEIKLENIPFKRKKEKKSSFSLKK